MSEAIKNIVIISDVHAGCGLALCPRKGTLLDDGGTYMPSAYQLKLCDAWDRLWKEWVPRVCRRGPFVLVNNGDTIDGTHHKSVTQISQNLTIQRQIAYELLAPVVKKAAAYYHIRGTEAHGGASGQEEEALARSLGAIPNEAGQHARYELWLEQGPALIHFTHAISTASAAAYETTAIQRELVNAFVESGRWGDRVPDVVCRSHRHRHAEVRIPSQHGFSVSFTTAGWQLKTPFVFRTASRMSQPQIGASLIRQGDEETHTRHYVLRLDRDKTERI